jgi:hypothetical protein
MRDAPIYLASGKQLRFYPDWLFALIIHGCRVLIGLMLLLVT